MSFLNQIVAGVKLVRAAIQSPNFVAGVSGWIIRRDGSAEFNNVVVRGSDTEPAIIVGPEGAPQVIIYNNGVNGVVELPTNDPNEDSPARLASVVYNQGAANERLSVELQGPAHDVDGDRLAIQINSANADSSAPARINIFDVATQDLLLYIERARLQVSEILQVAPEATASSALAVLGAAGHTGLLVDAKLNGANRFTVAANGDTNVVGALTAGNTEWGTAQTAAPGAGGGTTSVNVVFTNPLPNTARVQITPSSTADPGVTIIRGYVSNESTTGFTITCYRSTNAATNWRWDAISD